jgi:signal peptidase II
MSDDAEESEAKDAKVTARDDAKATAKDDAKVTAKDTAKDNAKSTAKADEADEADETDEADESDDAKPVAKDAVTKPTISAVDKTVAKAIANKLKWKLFWIVSIASLVADQATKIWARAALDTVAQNGDTKIICEIPADISSGKCIGVAHEVIGSFWHWRLSMNPGSAFGLFSGQGQAGRVLLSIVGIAAVAGMLWMLKKARGDQKVLHWALALVAGGAVGNLIDRIYYGVVTDFILWHWGSGQPRVPQGAPNHRFVTEWPVFNVADIVLVVGVGLMFIDIQKEGKREKAKKKRRQEKARAAGLVKDLK